MQNTDLKIGASVLISNYRFRSRTFSDSSNLYEDERDMLLF